jgi:SHS2 domain-containing protein
MPYQYLEEVAIADVAFRAWGTTLEETFIACAEATLNVMLEELDSLRLSELRTIELERDALDSLLFDFLQELIYYKDAELLLLRVSRVRIGEKDGAYALSAEARGEKLDPERHVMNVDVKAVTLHRFALARTDSGWEANVVLDV